jgi:hypothetical protein
MDGFLYKILEITGLLPPGEKDQFSSRFSIRESLRGSAFPEAEAF